MHWLETTSGKFLSGFNLVVNNATFPAKNRHLELSIPYNIMLKYPDLTGVENTKATQEAKRSQHWLLGGLVKMTIVVLAWRVGLVCIDNSHGRLESCQWEIPW